MFGSGGGRFKTSRVVTLQGDRSLGSKRKLVKQCRIEPDLKTIAVDKVDMIGQDFLARGDGCVECFDFQVEALNDAPACMKWQRYIGRTFRRAEEF